MIAAFRLLLGSFTALLMVACFAQKQVPRCKVPVDRVAILDPSAASRGPLPVANAVTISLAQVETSECILKDFIDMHRLMTEASRDSIYDASGGRIHPECLTRSWQADYRQYVAERTPLGALLVHVNVQCRLGIDPAKDLEEFKGVWAWVSDGGDCYFQAVVDLTAKQVVQFEVNGPNSRDKRCP